MAPAPAMDVNDEEGAGGGGARNNSSAVAVKSEAACTNTGPLLVDTDSESAEDERGGGDTTECSSSFGDTCSGFQDEAGDGEPEVNSGVSASDNGGRPWKPPRKKVTVEWRDSVRPILWRCQWLELRLRELSSQISKYDRELALNKKQKELQQAVSKTNGSMSESMQIHKGHGNSIMKRRKRKRHEENVDTHLYINKHQILSYYHDKQNKGAETSGLLIDENCGSTVPIRGRLDAVTLLDSEDYDVIFEQLALKDILLTIDRVQSRVHLLQDRLSKAHSEGENLAFSEGNTSVRVARKRHPTQKCSSYTEYRHTKPQKKKNLNNLLKDDDGPALAGRPLPDTETDAYIKDANRITEKRSGECKHSRDKAITVDLLLGIGNSIPNDCIGDICKENTDDILIDNQAANDTCEQFDKAKHLPSGTSSKEQNISAPAEMKKVPVRVFERKKKKISAPVEVKNISAQVKVDSTCAPVEVHSTCAPAAEQESSVEKSPLKKAVSPGNKQELNPKKKRTRKKGSFFTKKQRKEASKISAAKNQTESTPFSTKNQTESMPYAVAKEKTESTPSAATGLETMAARPAGKKRRSENEPAGTKKQGSGNSSLASKEQKTGKPSSAVKKLKTENSSTAAKKQEAESASRGRNKQATEKTSSTSEGAETANPSSKAQVEKAVLVAVDSRRSQRVRKPKVFTE